MQECIVSRPLRHYLVTEVAGTGVELTLEPLMVVIAPPCRHLRRPLSESLVHQLVGEAVDLEREFICEALQVISTKGRLQDTSAAIHGMMHGSAASCGITKQASCNSCLWSNTMWSGLLLSCQHGCQDVNLKAVGICI